ncbi:MAG TPA: hypothetical protein VKV28_08880 [Candidatus Binataceae bacterium]|nr:hypothetical protein [Candidatus Binataceae bacterium]
MIGPLSNASAVTPSIFWGMLALTLLALSVAACGSGGGSPSIPPAVTATVPDSQVHSQGMAAVVGRPGRVQPNTDVLASTTNPPAASWPLVRFYGEDGSTSGADGSFSLEVCAQVGAVIYVFVSPVAGGRFAPNWVLSAQVTVP